MKTIVSKHKPSTPAKGKSTPTSNFKQPSSLNSNARNLAELHHTSFANNLLSYDELPTSNTSPRAGVGHNYSKPAIYSDFEGPEQEEKDGFLTDQDAPAPPAPPGPAPVPAPAAAPAPGPAAGGLSVTIPTNIRASSSPAGMPDRIPPRIDTDVPVQISGWHPPLPPVFLSIYGVGGGNGTVTIDGGPTKALTGNAAIKLRGVNQTAVGSAGHLKLVADMGGNRLATSNGFSVSAIPQNFSITFNGLITGARRGIRVNNHWESDSGNVADLDEAERSEQVQYGAGTGVLAGAGAGAHNSGYLPAHNPPIVDSHGVGVAALTAPGSLIAEQTFIFKDKRTGATDIPVTNSGFRIARIIRSLLRRLLFKTEKRGTATTANGYASNAGAGSVARTQLV